MVPYLIANPFPDLSLVYYFLVGVISVVTPVAIVASYLTGKLALYGLRPLREFEERQPVRYSVLEYHIPIVHAALLLLLAPEDIFPIVLFGAPAWSFWIWWLALRQLAYTRIAPSRPRLIILSLINPLGYLPAPLLIFGIVALLNNYPLLGRTLLIAAPLSFIAARCGSEYLGRLLKNKA